MFFHYCFFFFLNFILIYIYYFFIQIDYFSLVNFTLNLEKMIVREIFLSLFFLRGMTFFHYIDVL
jgi:hypothetical protein